MTEVHLLLARGDEESIAKGQVLLTQLLQLVEAIHNTRKMIQVLALQAWAYDLQGREAEALEALERALVLARPGGFIRTFADLAPLANCFTNCASTEKRDRRSIRIWIPIYKASWQRWTRYLHKPVLRKISL